MTLQHAEKPDFTAAGRSAEHDRLVAESYRLIPSGTTTSALPVPGHEFIVARGEGAYIYDIDGRRFLDFFMGSGPLVLGHAHPRIVEALTRGALLGSHHLGLHRRTVELAERIVSLVPCADAIRFCASGTEATMHALRLARVHTGRHTIVKFDGAYHGHHDLAVWSISSDSNALPRPTPESGGTEPGMEDHVLVLPFNDAQAARDLLATRGHEVAAVICEPLQRTIPPQPGFLDALREACDACGALLIFDEVVTGFRLAPGGAQERYGVVPDIATVGKAISGGLPYAAVLGRAGIMAHFEHGRSRDSYSFHCGTYSGYFLGAECAHATLDLLLEEGGIDYLNAIGETAREALVRCCHDLGISATVVGDGALFEVYFTDGPVLNQADIRRSNLAFGKTVHRHMMAAGIYRSSVKAYLSTAHGEPELAAYVDIFRRAVEKTLDS